MKGGKLWGFFWVVVAEIEMEIKIFGGNKLYSNFCMKPWPFSISIVHLPSTKMKYK